MANVSKIRQFLNWPNLPYFKLESAKILTVKAFLGVCPLSQNL
jgi:hypothetical protein